MLPFVYALVVIAFSLKVYQVSRAIKGVKGLPSIVCGFPPLSIIGSILPPSSLSPGLRFVWDWKNLYQRKGSELISIVPLVVGRPWLYTCSPEIMKQVLGFDSTFEKTEVSLALDILGPNVVASAGKQWRRHRKITAPAFNQNTFRDVWRETAGIYKEMTNAEGWDTTDTIVCESFNHFTTKVALLVITACGFGVRLPWSQSSSSRGEVDVYETIVTVASSILARISVPRWAYYLPISRLHRIEKAYVEFERLMKEHIASRRSQIRKKLELHDPTVSLAEENIFGRLVHANETENDINLDDQELLGNCFIFLFAGHETTAHTLVVTLALLGIYQTEQERVFKHIKNVSERAPDFSFDDSPELSPVLSCFYEALRLYPAAYCQVRYASEDTILTYPSVSHPGTEENFLVLQGTAVAVDLVGAGRNARHFPEPELFKPSRWDESVEAAIGFSQGPRVCLGRKLATTEATCFLAHILRDWKVHIVLAEGETPAEWQSRVLAPKFGVTLKTGDVPLKFTRRSA